MHKSKIQLRRYFLHSSIIIQTRNLRYNYAKTVFILSIKIHGFAGYGTKFQLIKISIALLRCDSEIKRMKPRIIGSFKSE